MKQHFIEVPTGVKPRRQFILFYFRLTPIDIVKTVEIVDDRQEVYRIRAVITVGHHIFYCSPCPVCSDVILLVERLRRYPDLNTNNLGELVADSRSIRTVIHISNSFSSNVHFDITAKKATQSLNFIRRNFSCCPAHIREQCYKTLVRPQLQYASSVWDNTIQRNVEPAVVC